MWWMLLGLVAVRCENKNYWVKSSSLSALDVDCCPPKLILLTYVMLQIQTPMLFLSLGFPPHPVSFVSNRGWECGLFRIAAFSTKT